MSVTIHDVAKAARVSTATVSNVLNSTGKVGRETRRLVLATVRKLGYIRDVHARHFDGLWELSSPTSRIHFFRR